MFSHAQIGTWSGKLDVQGTKISVVFHLDEENPTIDSPDQGAKEIPIEVTRTATGSITIDTYAGMPLPSASQFELPAALSQNLTAVIRQLSLPYLKHIVKLDIRPLLGGISCPVLALNGTKDMQVDADSNLGALRIGLPDKPCNKLEAVEGVNHLFQHCRTGMPTEYRDMEETFAQGVWGIRPPVYRRY